MQQWEYKVFASHLDPAELVLLLDESGREGWELVTLVSIVDDLPVAVLEPAAVPRAFDTDEVGEAAAQPLNTDELEEEVVAMQAFRYIFKRPVATL